ncbi:hypothetical protein, partial [Pseudomonas syringae]|uniref:hypothetical protein n=1 Tax=Pseudomonas syringae TaxID=317 RepID=UPI001FBA360A
VPLQDVAVEVDIPDQGKKNIFSPTRTVIFQEFFSDKPGGGKVTLVPDELIVPPRGSDKIFSE